MLHAFKGIDGARPYAGLVRSSDGNFYGTTTSGGKSGQGTVFRITPAGELSSLCSFDGKNGSMPKSALILGADENLYGVAQGGGIGSKSRSMHGMGTVFRVSQKGELTTLSTFSGTNGVNPRCRLVQGEDGSIYGTTEYGGVSYGEHDYGAGTIFSIKVSR